MSLRGQNPITSANEKTKTMVPSMGHGTLKCVLAIFMEDE